MFRYTRRVVDHENGIDRPAQGRGDDTLQDQLDAETRTASSLSDVRSVDLRVPGLTILGHPDVRRIGDRVALPELVSGREVLLSRIEPAFASPRSDVARPLADVHLSRKPLRLIPAKVRGALVVDPTSTRTQVKLDGEVLEERRDLRAAEVERGVVLVLGRRVVLLLHTQEPMSRPVPTFGLVGESAAMGRVRRDIERVAGLDVSVLLRGETGTGKELVAQAIHEASGRRGPFLAVNMAAIPPSLAASELFGAARGAYTGADRKRDGFFRRAKGGTLLLDEIGETPPEVQVMLLRALESREGQPVGGAETYAIEARVVAATDADLESRIEAGRFREPLLHRLAGYEILLPPLRQRRSDLGRLFLHFLALELETLGQSSVLGDSEKPWPSPEIFARLALFPWPGNVRQLRNVTRRLAIVGTEASGSELLDHLEGLLKRASSSSGSGSSEVTDSTSEASVESDPGKKGDSSVRTSPQSSRIRYRKPSEVEEEELLAALREHRWELKPTAEALGISRASLYVLVENCDRIRKAVDLGAQEIEEALVKNSRDLEQTASALEVSVQGLKRRMTALGLR